MIVDLFDLGETVTADHALEYQLVGDKMDISVFVRTWLAIH